MKRADVSGTRTVNYRKGICLAYFKPVFLVQSKLPWSELPSTGMPIVIKVNLGMTLKTNRNRIFDFIRSPVCTLYDMVKFHFYTAEPVTNATPPMTCSNQLFSFLVIKAHSLALSKFIRRGFFSTR